VADCVFGRKPNRHAYVLCNNAPDGRSWVNVIVARLSSDDQGLDMERDNIRRRIGNGNMSLTPNAGPPGQAFSGLKSDSTTER